MNELALLDARRTIYPEGVFLRFGMLMLTFCVVLPFVGQAFPYGTPIFGPVVFFTFCVVLISRLRVNSQTFINLNVGTYGVLLLLVLETFLYGILRTDTLADYRSHVIKDFLNGVEALLLCVAAVNIPWTPERLEKFGNRVITLLIAVSAILDFVVLYKVVLLQQGVQIPFIANGNPGRPYPWGSSLVDDYDFYSLVMLCGMLGSLYRIIAVKGWTRRLGYLGGLVVMAAAGFLSGSRRFWVLAPLLIAFELFWLLKRKRGGFFAVRWFSFVLVIVVISFISALGPIDSVLGLSVGGLDIGLRLQSLVTSQGSHGLGERVALARYAFDLLNGWTILFGHGFDYLREFGCQFAGCKTQNYPHNPILSAFLYGGIISALAVIIFIIYIVTLIMKSLSDGGTYLYFGLSLAAEWIFISVSGNTILSVKSLLVTAIVCMLYQKYRLNYKANYDAHFTHRH